MSRDVAVAVAIVLGFNLAGLVCCGAASNAPCSPDVLASIEARYSAEVLASCADAGSVEACPAAVAFKVERAASEKAAKCR